MKNLELECVPKWRFTPIPRGQKGPKTKGWMKNPQTLEQIEQDINIGVMLGEVSGGLLAIDFDGPSAFNYWIENIGVPFQEIDTITWSSGAEGRCQMAFWVPPEVWQYMPGKFAVTTGDKEQLEWRWAKEGTGIQSVVPPSLHPSGRNYEWLRSPSKTQIQLIPVKLMEWALEHNRSIEAAAEIELDVPTLDNLQESVYNECIEFLDRIKHYIPRPDYDQWFKIIGATSNMVGDSVAAYELNSRWREEHPGEYMKKIKSRNPNKSGGAGTLVHLIRQHEPNYRKRSLPTNKNII
jgi:hypothetical protein